MRRALVGCLALALGCGPIGTFLVIRRMSLMGDALSHAVLPGAALGFILGGLSLPAMSLGGVGAGLVIAPRRQPRPPAPAVRFDPRDRQCRTRSDRLGGQHEPPLARGDLPPASRRMLRSRLPARGWRPRRARAHRFSSARCAGTRRSG